MRRAKANPAPPLIEFIADLLSNTEIFVGATLNKRGRGSTLSREARCFAERTIHERRRDRPLRTTS